MTLLIGLLLLVVVVQTQDGVAEDYYYEEQPHFATDLESQCQYEDMVTDETSQNEQYQNHDAVPKVPVLRRKRPLNAPCIDGRAVINVSAVVGGTADLLCTVRQLNEHKVTWSKLGELFPISIDTRLFTPNLRFSLLRNVNATKKNPHWNIRILDVQLSDAGIYSCQMNTHPIKARRIYLQVDDNVPRKQNESSEVQKTGRSKKPGGGTRKQPTVQPQTESSNDSPRRSGNANLEQQQLIAPNAGPSVQVTGSQDVDLGAQIKLMCVAQGKHGKPPASISWYRNSFKVSTSNPPNSSLPARLVILESAKYNELVSWLNIQSAQSSDQGRYTCRTPEGSASIDVQVFRDVGDSGQNSPLGSDSRAASRTRLVPSREASSVNNNMYNNNMQAIRSQNAAGARRHEFVLVISALFITFVCDSLQRRSLPA